MANQQPKIPSPIDVCLGRQLQNLRREQGVSREALADAIGVTFQQLRKYELGVNRIAASRLVEIAAALNVPLLSLFEGAEEIHRRSRNDGLDTERAGHNDN